MWLILKEGKTLLHIYIRGVFKKSSVKTSWSGSLRVRKQWGTKLSVSAEALEDSPLFFLLPKAVGLKFGGTLFRTLRHLMLSLFESIKP